jgi:hypothetical protein
VCFWEAQNQMVGQYHSTAVELIVAPLLPSLKMTELQHIRATYLQDKFSIGTDIQESLMPFRDHHKQLITWEKGKYAVVHI